MSVTVNGELQQHMLQLHSVNSSIKTRMSAKLASHASHSNCLSLTTSKQFTLAFITVVINTCLARG